MRRSLIRSGAAAIAVALPLMTVGVAQAGGGEWDYKGSFDFVDKGDSNSPYETHAVYSGGGSLKVCVYSATTEHYWYELMEWDPGKNEDEVVGSFRGAGCRVFSNLDQFVDGNNKRAEFYVTTQDVSAIHAEFWD